MEKRTTNGKQPLTYAVEGVITKKTVYGMGEHAKDGKTSLDESDEMKNGGHERGRVLG